MDINLALFDKQLEIDTIQLQLENGSFFPIDVLRLDKVHDTISGNKWFKLKYNLLAAQRAGATSIISFGGAYSNHLHALAYAGYLFGIPTIGIVRGEPVSNDTLDDCKKWGMDLRFISRADYRLKNEASFLNKLKRDFPHSFIVPEGGDNELGVKGCAEILSETLANKYDILCCSIGTGTTIRGLAAKFKNKIWGFSALKNAHSLEETLCHQIPNLTYYNENLFGGFAKSNALLETFIASFKKDCSIELDKVYTAKMFYNLKQALSKFSPDKKTNILAVHTGGLQGNR